MPFVCHSAAQRKNLLSPPQPVILTLSAAEGGSAQSKDPPPSRHHPNRLYLPAVKLRDTTRDPRAKEFLFSQMTGLRLRISQLQTSMWFTSSDAPIMWHLSNLRMHYRAGMNCEDKSNG